MPETDGRLLERLAGGDEVAFRELVDRHTAAMLRFAACYTHDRAAAEDAVQEAWIGVLRGARGFAGRASFRTWLFRILLNRVRSQQRRDARAIPFSALPRADEPAEPAVDDSRFLEADHPRWPHHWRAPPVTWTDSPEERLMALEGRRALEQAVAALPPAQREVITLRDIEGWSAHEVCNLLRISASNQRVLLHRARSRVRRSLEEYFGD
ncbi:MAG TPA: RNA polymerase sigma factor [Longimicrobiales bacterium]